ncbi:MAG: ABC transporter permease [Lachnospiraceae bacterium]|nr:ABC transporter permease [Lachnospiraceae bacterium]
MRVLLWAEMRKLRRSSILWIAVFALIVAAGFIGLQGLERYEGPDLQSGLKSLSGGICYINNPGWYLDQMQTLMTIFVLPAMIALLGSYTICREEEEDTDKNLRMIPVNKDKLITSKMILNFGVSVLLYFFLFIVAFSAEYVLHGKEISRQLALESLKEYLLDGVGVFMVVAPIVAFIAYLKTSYWLAIVFTELYSCGGMFASMSRLFSDIYPINAVFNLSGFRNVSAGQKALSGMVLLFSLALAVLLLIGLRYSTGNRVTRRGKKNGKETV